MPTNMFMLEYEDALMISQLIRISSDHPGPTDKHRLTSASVHTFIPLFHSCLADYQKPFALVILTKDELIVHDLQNAG